ncbi:MAG TPA: response regulator [Spirochaetia bacterium]|nr:response regulator [Spirochaetales bacterium]HRY72101.1 response regulator [Spirochaetia bacterium]
MDEILLEAFGCFVLECDELVQKAVDSTLELEDGGGAEAVDALMRALHTIKGNARMFELEAIPAIAHAAESLAARLKREGLRSGRAETNLLLESLDAIKSRVAAVAAGSKEEAARPELLAALESARAPAPAASGLAATTAAPRAASRPTPAAQSAAAQAAPASQPAAAPAAPALRPAVAAHPTAAPRAEARPAAAPPAVDKPAPFEARAEPSSAAAAPSVRPSAAAAGSRALSILLVDDDFLQRRSSQHILAQYGSCAVAAGGDEAVEAVARSLEPGAEPFDLIVVDLVMPGMDGFEVVRSIRSLEMAFALEELSSGAAGVGDLARKDARILVASVLDDPASYMKACFRCGADGYLLKPVEPARLEKELARLGLA